MSEEDDYFVQINKKLCDQEVTCVEKVCEALVQDLAPYLFYCY